MKHWLSVIFTLLLAFPGLAHLASWKVHGPDISGGYGGMQGAGGLELTVRESDGALRGVLSDYHGNTVGTFDGVGTLSWVEARVNGYGPLLGMEAPVLSAGVGVVECGLWRGQRIDPTGLYWLGERYYEPVSGRFLSPDPLGHAASRGLDDFCDADPVNRFDADGRLGKAISSAFSSIGSSLGGSGSLGTTWFDAGMGKYLDDIRYAYSSSGQAMQAYHQTQADMARMYSFNDSKDPSLGGFMSSALNLTPGVGSLKEWIEYGFTGKDLITGERKEQGGNSLALAAGITAGLIPLGMPARGGAALLKTEVRALSTEVKFAAEGGAGRLVQGEFDFVKGLNAQRQGYGPLPAGERPYQLTLFPDKPYDRVAFYGNSPTAAQRSAAAPFSFDHDPALVQHYWEGNGRGGLPGFNLTQTERLQQAQSLNGNFVPRSMQNYQGWLMKNYSVQKNLEFGF